MMSNEILLISIYYVFLDSIKSTFNHRVSTHITALIKKKLQRELIAPNGNALRVDNLAYHLKDAIGGGGGAFNISFDLNFSLFLLFVGFNIVGPVFVVLVSETSIG
ncbi:MAG: hypothetical protein QG556_541 [Pseudomonadota bacterium]|nr:hypothetical protein [Pseudomonadota bacterium]